MNKINRNKNIEKRIREIKRKMLHQRDSLVRKIWREHIEYLESQLIN